MKKKHKRVSITTDEWFVIGSIAALATTLIALLPPMMNSPWFTDLIPPIQYLIYNIGFILLTIVLIGVPISYLHDQAIEYWNVFRSGVSSWLIFSFILDVWQPPFAFGTNGSSLINDPHSLYGASVDHMLGWVYLHFVDPTVFFNLPVLGPVSFLFILIYFITPICAVFVSALLFKPGFLVSMFGNEVL